MVCSKYDSRISRYAATMTNNTSIPDDISHRDFELWCRDVLSNQGWAAVVTRATRDQGADVVAKKAGISAILQCKLYSTPIGNKAVQEAYAAQKYYMADISAVVSNSSFTKSAYELARYTDVKLLHIDELSNFDKFVGLPTDESFVEKENEICDLIDSQLDRTVDAQSNITLSPARRARGDSHHRRPHGRRHRRVDRQVRRPRGGARRARKPAQAVN